MDLKTCYNCKKDRPTEQFGNNRARKDGLQARCKECDREYHNKQYASNPKLHRRIAKAVKKRKVEWFIEYKKTLQCRNCGENRWYVLDFHHLGEKKDTLSQLVADNVSKKRIMDEVTKCVPLCANCHRELHHFERSA